MTKEQAINILEFYSEIDKEIKFHLETIKNIEDEYYSLSSCGIVGGGGGGSGISDPTAKRAFAIPEHIREARQYSEDKARELSKLKEEIYKELDSLKYSYKYILIKFYIEKKQWLYISTKINYSERQCKNIRNIALAKLSKQFKENKIIRGYKFLA